MDEETRLVIRIMHLAYLVQRLTEYCVFINFAGHVNRLEVSISPSKENWQTKVLTSEMQAAYNIRRHGTPDSHRAELQARVDVLEKILTDRQIPFGELQYEEEIQRAYYF